MYIYIYIYIYIYTFRQMPTFNVLFKIYGQKKPIIYLKSEIFLFFSEAFEKERNICIFK